MSIITKKPTLALLSIYRKCACIGFLLCILFSKAQIYQTNGSSLYISEGASIIECKKNNETVEKNNNSGKIFISENTVVYNDSKALSAKIVFIGSVKKNTVAKNHLPHVPKQKKTKPEKNSEPVSKPEFNFTSAKSDSNFKTGYANGSIAFSNTTVQIKAILTKNANFNSNITVSKTSVNSFIRNENIYDKNISYFFVRPPPLV